MPSLNTKTDNHFAHLRRRLQEVASNPYAVKRLRAEVDRLRAQHRRASARHEKTLNEINTKIATFNNTVPIASLLKIPFSVTTEMQKYEDRVPAFLTYGQPKQ